MDAQSTRGGSTAKSITLSLLTWIAVVVHWEMEGMWLKCANMFMKVGTRLKKRERIRGGRKPWMKLRMLSGMSCTTGSSHLMPLD